MSEAFKPGDRVRVRIGGHPHGYKRGDQGTVVQAATRATTGAPCYLVAMDKDGPDATAVLFAGVEIEPDV